MSPFGGGLNWSAQRFNILAKIECGHKTAATYLLFGSPAIRVFEWFTGRRTYEFDWAPV